MSQCIDVISAISAQEIQNAKRAFWEATTLTSSIQGWMGRKASSFLSHREQIRVLSVYSCDPEVDIYLCNKIKEVMARFRYVVVEPCDARYFDNAFSSVRESSLHSIEVSPYPHFLTYNTLERFDLVMVFGLPINRNAAEVVIHKAKSLLRHGGQAYIFNSSDNELSDMIHLLHSMYEEVQSGNNDISSVMDNSLLSPEFLNYHPCGEGRDGADPRTPESMDLEEEKTSVLSNSILVDNVTICSILDEMKVTYASGQLNGFIDLAECFKESPKGIFILSGLLKIDLTGLMEPLINSILENLRLRLRDDSTALSFDFSVFSLLSDVLADFIKRTPDPTPSAWFPEGAAGPFRNAGLESWTKHIQDWRSEGTDEPMKRMSDAAIDDTVEIISNSSIVSCKLPEAVNLDELIPLCMEVWKCEGL